MIKISQPEHKTDSQNRTFSVPVSPSDFTGKERDEETGYGYFGARYMDHELMTTWLSVDPMADKYPNIGPYAYCAWNPVKLVDPDGEDPIKPLVKYMGQGTFMVNTANLRKATRSQIELANSMGAHDENSIGVNLCIGSYQSPIAKPVVPSPVLQKAIGIEKKVVSTSERKNIEIARKSIVAKCNIKRGDIFSEENLTCKRPATGISPMKWNEIIV